MNLTIKITEDGKVSIDVKEAKGDSCSTMTNHIFTKLKELGISIDVQDEFIKPEFYEVGEWKESQTL